ncbi:MAG: response regulator [Myxococcaceae bacterium]|nr:response regulator [Myxococcaceae bacterium]
MPKPNPASHRILIVDDDPDWRSALRLMLDDLGYDSVEAASGEEALLLLEQEPFRIVLLDMNMPGLSGYDVIARLPDPSTRVVLLTASSAQEVGDTLNKTAAYYLPKDAGEEALGLILESLQA